MIGRYFVAWNACFCLKNILYFLAISYGASHFYCTLLREAEKAPPGTVGINHDIHRSLGARPSQPKQLLRRSRQGGYTPLELVSKPLQLSIF